MNDKINIICLYWVGDFRGRDFTADDVWNLYEQVSDNINQEFNFYTLTNEFKSELPGKRIALKNDWPGWWSKIELHRDDLPEGRTLYLDLDTYVINNLQPVLDYEGDLVMFPSPYKGKLNHIPNICCKYQAGIMLFNPGKFYWIYREFSESARLWMKKFRSDQDLMGKWIPDQPTFPSKWMQKLAFIKNEKPSDEVIFITGQPKDENFRCPSFAPWLTEVRDKERRSLKM